MKYVVRKTITAMLLAALILFGAMGAGTAQAAVPTAPPTVGLVDFPLLINQHPDTQKANETLKAETEAAKKEFEAKSAGLGDKEKQDLNLQLMRQVEQKRQELLRPIADKINAAVREVAEAKGMAIVVQKGVAVYGGLDITDDVLKKISGK
ncbi:MAG: OmpH family outer membrane protein [Negativicutes bacterium]|nr:OmpH family outer membrane protein [Negativicutes bacterium]